MVGEVSPTAPSGMGFLFEAIMNEKEKVLIGTLLLDFEATAKYMKSRGFTSDDIIDDDYWIAARMIASQPYGLRNMAGVIIAVREMDTSDNKKDALIGFCQSCVRSVWSSDNPFGIIAFMAAKKSLSNMT